jgi:membrane-associated HD superfamily phosphohydrolase
MMADSVEAASRSLKDFCSDSINALVDKIVDGQKKEGLFNESPLSFKDVEVVKNTFKKRLSTIYHSRIVYPELHNSENEEDAAAESK